MLAGLTAPPPRGFFAKLKAGFANAFSLAPQSPTLAPEEEALLDRIAEAVVRRGLATPAVLGLESMKPVHFLGSQALYALRPVAHAVLRPEEYDRVARILERRDGIEELIVRIERRA